MKKLYFGGPILTMEKEGDYAEALLTEGGTILALGSLAELCALAPDAERIDLRDACLMPAFLDAHSHFSQVASGMMQVSLEGVRCTDEIAARIAAFCREVSPAAGEWIFARGYDPHLLSDGKNPSLAALDAFSGEHPLVLQYQSGHMGLFNSMALAALGITPDTPSPQGGTIEVLEGKLTGYLEENAYFAAIKAAPMISPQKMLESYRRAQQKYASLGITTIQEGMFVRQMFPFYPLLEKEGILKLDLVAYAELPAWEAAKAEFPGHIRQYKGNWKLGGLKIFLDGSPQGRTAWMRTPYRGEAEYCGYGTMKDSAVLGAMNRAAEEGVQLLAHCNGDAAAAQFLRCLSECEKTCPQMKALRPVMIHAQLLGKDQIAEARRLGVIASFFVAHVWHWGDTHLQNFGRERATGISPSGSALREGLPFTFHQDAPVIEPNMLETVWCAVNRRTKKGFQLEEAERIPVFEALKAVTATAAYQYFEENEKGTLRAGKCADFVILGSDPLMTDPEKLRDIPVLQTIKAGEVIYSTH